MKLQGSRGPNRPHGKARPCLLLFFLGPDPVVAQIAQLAGVRKGKFLPDAVAIGLHGLGAKVEVGRNFPHINSVADQVQDFQFAIAQQIDRSPWLRRAVGIIGQDPLLHG